ncbi:MAG: sugar nucleotide-binding protein [Chitinophagaceae bacterium]|jgi:dTDP-4-dehydrorhamnose reductase|nr:sugar nucleotide-binding protein [Chitinophagaceae bacterium]
MRYKQILVLGANGMLGQMTVYFFRRVGYKVIPFNEKFTTSTISLLANQINDYEASIIINCIGKIPQKSTNEIDLVTANTLLPLELARKLKNDHLLIHPSTDCVFSGYNNIFYPKNYEVNPKDFYGMSKAWGEFILTSRPNTIITRVSLIGPDKNSEKGLLQWFLSQQSGSTISGFTNHYWNGITTYEWCKQIESLLNTFVPMDRKFIQLGFYNGCSKFELLSCFKEVYKHDVNIVPMSTGQIVDRRLEPELISPDIQQQLIEMKTEYKYE